MSLDHVALDDPHVPAHNAERDAINQLQEDVGLRIPAPIGAAYGDILWFDGINWVTTETRFLEGEGRPEGAKAAPVGSRYIDKTAETGGVEWVKVTGGDSATGWICLSGSTGLRNIAGDIAVRSTGVANKAFVQRVGQQVEFYLDIKMPNNTASPYDVYTLPPGFRPNYTIYGALTDNKEGADTGGTAVGVDGVVHIYNPVAAKTDRYHGTWLTDDAWPSSLPGSAG